MGEVAEINQEFKAAVTSLGQSMLQHENRIHAEPVHCFAEGLYCRELTMEAGSMWVSRVHKHDNFAFILEGSCTVISEHGAVDYFAPCRLTTKSGTQRALKIHDGQDCTWVTVHALPAALEGASIEQIEDFYACDTLDEYEQHLLTMKDQQKELPL